MARPPVAGERSFVAALAERTKEILPKDEFAVTSNGLTITVCGVGRYRGKTNVLMPVFILRADLPCDERLALAIRSHGKRLQEFVSLAYHSPWPIADAEVHVSISDDAVSLWWSKPNETQPVLALRPIPRQAIGM
jgi:hypothetical protein